MDSNLVIILDIRVPMLPVAQLNGHKSCVNSISWAPHSWYFFSLTISASTFAQLEMITKL